MTFKSIKYFKINKITIFPLVFFISLFFIILYSSILLGTRHEARVSGEEAKGKNCVRDRPLGEI